MKNLFALLAFAGLAFAACSDNDDNIVPPPADDGTVTWGGVKYQTVTLKDGRTWMAENLRYVPEGKTVSGDPTENSGIWYPQEVVAESEDVYKAVVSTDAEYVVKVGYYYDFLTAVGIAEITAENSTTFEGAQGICPDGWHIPTEAEFTALLEAYRREDGKTYWADFNEDGFNAILTQMRSKNTSVAPGAWASAINASTHVFSGGWMMSSTANMVNGNNYKVNETTGAVTTQNKVLMFLDTYVAASGLTNQTTSLSNASNFAGIPVRCIKNE